MRPLFILLTLLVTAGCSPLTPERLPTPPSVEALYGVAEETALFPYPSDRYTVSDATSATGKRVRLGPAATSDSVLETFPSLVDTLDGMEGFSTIGGVAVAFSGPVDVRGLVLDETAEPPLLDPLRDPYELTTKGSPFLLVDVDEASPEHGRARGLVFRWWAEEADASHPDGVHLLIAKPATPLLPSTRYLFVVTNALAAADGGGVGRSAETERLLSGHTDGDYALEIGAALDDLESKVGVARESVVLATAFTTAPVLDGTLAMAALERAADPPALLSAWEVETPLGMSRSDKRIRYRADFEARDYRRPLPDGKWHFEDGKPTVDKTTGLEVFLTFSDATASGPRPVVIFGHGLGGTKEACWAATQWLESLGVAVFAIDAPEHGSRSEFPGNAFRGTFAFFGIDQETLTFDLGIARDNFRQSAADTLGLVRLVGTLGDLDLLPAGAPDGVPDLDVSRIIYVGVSFGAVLGPTIFAIAPEIRHALWNVGGNDLTTLVGESTTFKLLLGALVPPGTPRSDLGRFLAMSQAVVDPGDPVNFAKFGALEPTPGVPGWTPRDMLLQEAMGDSIIPNSATEALARAAGLTLVDPIRPIGGLASAPAPLAGNLAGGATGAVSQFDVAYGNRRADHTDLLYSPEARQQWIEFLRTSLADGHGTVLSSYPKGP